MKKLYFKMFLAVLSLLVGLLYLAPFLIIEKHLASRGQSLVFGFESHRNDLVYLAWAREIYDGHFPPRDLFSLGERPVLQNPLPSALMAGLLTFAGGDVRLGYFIAAFLFSQINFLLFYLLGSHLFHSRLWAVFFALVAILTPMALRIFNFDGTA